ncbi:MAG: ribonuclease P protein component [Nocardioides sp.]
MLPAARRLTDADRFRQAIREGRRAGSPTLVVHLGDHEPAATAQVGLVVNRAVGNAVHRNRVKRRLRHLAAERVSALPTSAVLVIRALPPAGSASYAELRTDLDRCLTRVTS